MGTRICTGIVGALLGLVVSASGASAADDGLAGSRLQMKQTSSRESLKLSARDEAAAFPAPASPDDPSVAGATLDLENASGATMTIDLPAAGWTETSSGWSFRSKDLPDGATSIRTARLKNSKSLKLKGDAVDFDLADPQTAVSARLTIGASRYCAVFALDSRRKDGDGAFDASSDSSSLADCDDDTMAAASCDQTLAPTCAGQCVGGGVCASDGGSACICADPGPSCTDPFPSCTGSCGVGGLGTCGPDIGSSSCKCLHPSQPCGGTSPVCNGACGDGEQCASIATAQDFSPECICIPEAATPCGSPGAPTCGGACDGSRVCQPIYQFPSSGGDLVCTCGSASACGSGGLDCTDGFACGIVGGSPSCVPMFCAGTYPVCGGACGDGGTCRPIDINGLTQTCICTSPAATTCDVCGGAVCGDGEVCRVQTDPQSCGCEAP